MNRRRFLKYAGVTAAVVGATTLELGHQIRATPLMPNQISSTITSTITSESRRNLSGKIFFDRNLNGVQDSGEPAVKGVEVKSDGGETSITNDDGEYSLDLKEGTHSLSITAPENFKYMRTSRVDLMNITQRYTVNLLEDIKLNIGLMEGFLTLPYSRNARITGGNWAGPDAVNYYDRDGRMEHWKFWDDKPHSVHDNNNGLDIFTARGSDILAAAPGYVSFIDNISSGSTLLTINHSFRGIPFLTLYGHFDKVTKKVGDIVRGGEKIGECGITGTQIPHLHFCLAWLSDCSPSFGLRCDAKQSNAIYLIDPYKPQFPLDEYTRGFYDLNQFLGLGVSGYDPTFKWVTATSEAQYKIITENYWTVENDPQFPD